MLLKSYVLQYASGLKFKKVKKRVRKLQCTRKTSRCMNCLTVEEMSLKGGGLVFSKVLKQFEVLSSKMLLSKYRWSLIGLSSRCVEILMVDFLLAPGWTR